MVDEYTGLCVLSEMYQHFSSVDAGPQTSYE